MCLGNKKCNWCKDRKSHTVKFKGYHKYTGMIICEGCFDKKWPTLDFESYKRISG